LLEQNMHEQALMYMILYLYLIIEQRLYCNCIDTDKLIKFISYIKALFTVAFKHANWYFHFPLT